MSALCLYVLGFFFGTPPCASLHPPSGGRQKIFGPLRSPVRTPLNKTLKPPLLFYHSSAYFYYTRQVGKTRPRQLPKERRYWHCPFNSIRFILNNFFVVAKIGLISKFLTF
jgi:hypothetical protein